MLCDSSSSKFSESDGGYGVAGGHVNKLLETLNLLRGKARTLPFDCQEQFWLS